VKRHRALMPEKQAAAAAVINFYLTSIS